MDGATSITQLRTLIKNVIHSEFHLTNVASLSKSDLTAIKALKAAVRSELKAIKAIGTSLGNVDSGSKERFGGLVRKLKPKFDWILEDASPLAASADDIALRVLEHVGVTTSDKEKDSICYLAWSVVTEAFLCSPTVSRLKTLAKA